MKRIKRQRLGAIMLVIVMLPCWVIPAMADEFTQEDLTRWGSQYMTVVKQGRKTPMPPTHTRKPTPNSRNN